MGLEMLLCFRVAFLARRFKRVEAAKALILEDPAWQDLTGNR